MPHLTRVLHKILPTFHWKRKWRLFGEVRKIGQPEIPPSFLKDNVTIINAAEEQKKLENVVEDYCEWEEDHPQFWSDPGQSPKNPKWKDEPARVFDKSSRLLEGS